MNHTKKKLPTQPFFTRFLDRQDLKQIGGAVAHAPDSTDKFPSDNDEHAGFPQE
jgi:hypothetical protein